MNCHSDILCEGSAEIVWLRLAVKSYHAAWQGQVYFDGMRRLCGCYVTYISLCPWKCFVDGPWNICIVRMLMTENYRRCNTIKTNWFYLRVGQLWHQNLCCLVSYDYYFFSTIWKKTLPNEWTRVHVYGRHLYVDLHTTWSIINTFTVSSSCNLRWIDF